MCCKGGDGSPNNCYVIHRKCHGGGIYGLLNPDLHEGRHFTRIAYPKCVWCNYSRPLNALHICNSCNKRPKHFCSCGKEIVTPQYSKTLCYWCYRRQASPLFGKPVCECGRLILTPHLSKTRCIKCFYIGRHLVLHELIRHLKEDKGYTRNEILEFTGLHRSHIFSVLAKATIYLDSRR